MDVVEHRKIAKRLVAGSAPSAELIATRKMMEGVVAGYPRHADVTFHYQSFHDVRCLVITPASVQGRMLYFHGGGFRLGSPEVVAGFTSHIAARSGCEIIIPFYSLSPEQPFPTALLEGQAVLQALLAECTPGHDKLLLGGDSAGGNLATVLAQHYAESLHGLWLLSPWLDVRVLSSSYERNAAFDPMFSRKSAQDAAALYLQDQEDPSDPDISPLLGDLSKPLSKLPATMILVGSNEVLLDDSLDFAQRMAMQHGALALHVMPDMTHVEATLRYDSHYTREVIELTARFLTAQLNG